LTGFEKGQSKLEKNCCSSFSQNTEMGIACKKVCSGLGPDSYAGLTSPPPTPSPNEKFLQG